MAAKASSKATPSKKDTKSRVDDDTGVVPKKLWPLYILKVLKRHANDGAAHDDRENPYLMCQQIVDFLADDYGVGTQARAVGDNLKRLYEVTLDDPALGFRLEYLSGDRKAPGSAPEEGERQLKHEGWRLVTVGGAGLDFEPSEVRMLIDTVIASSIIPPTQIDDLIKKLEPLSRDEIVVPNIEREGHLPAVNHQFFLNIEDINAAISHQKRVEFYLGAFDKDGVLQRVETGRRGRCHRVVPLQLLISKGHYYLLAHYLDSEEIYKFRIDLMLDLKIGEDCSADEPEPQVNVVKFREQHSYMMSGKVMNVTLRIDKESLHTLYDQFGPQVHPKNEREDTIDVSFKSALYSVLFWALQYYRSVEVLSPPELRQVLAEAGQTIHDMYAGEPGTIPFADRQSNDKLINGK